MAVPAFVREFCDKIVGTRVARLGFVDAFSGTIAGATVKGKRIQYEVFEDSGKTRFVFADEPWLSHVQPERIEVSG